MKKKLWKQWRFWLEVGLGLIALVFLFTTISLALTVNEMETAKQPESVSKIEENNSSEQKSNSKILKPGDSYTFSKEDYTNSTGLKITVDSITVDKNLQLNSESSSQDFGNLIPVVVKTTFENTTDKFIDIGSFELLSNNGEMGLWKPYQEGVSSGMPDGLNAGQKVNMVQVFGSPTEKNFDLSYSGVTWRFE
ncbi:hypothetical protein ACVRW4_04470 [Streptococcus phocae subsp. phocae]|uniref:DUF4352 domain-containing protein n=1 Tax=Streptococcus phocae TaxID=119224 RepID=A0A0N8FX56_9STRE|nr:hypothetical protein [Streptococcus phocae]KPJ22195.1 hypothetical protein AKK44_05880 [Streptococcus phocae]